MVCIACASQTLTFTPCLLNPDGWGGEQRGHPSLGRLKSCCTLDVETLGAVMSSFLWPCCGCGGYTVSYGLRWPGCFPKCFELLETLLLDEVQLLVLSIQHEI